MKKSILSRMGFFTQTDKEEIEKHFAELSKELLTLKKDILKVNQHINDNHVKYEHTFINMQEKILQKLMIYEETNKNIVSETLKEEKNMLSFIKECLNQQHEELITLKKFCQILLENSNTINEVVCNIDRNILVQLKKTVVNNHEALSKYITKNQDILLEKIKIRSEKEYQYMELQKKRNDDIIAFLKESFLQQNNKIAIVKTMCENILKNNDEIKITLNELSKNKLTKEDLDVISSFLRLLAANQLMQIASECVEE